MKKYTYDAFISYSHNEKDAFAAEQLHKTLEHYHIPKRIQQSSGKKKIERVFRDREEMPISFNLASNIQEALEQSEFLILMCSPNSIKSEWVQREVETFLKSHICSHRFNFDLYRLLRSIFRFYLSFFITENFRKYFLRFSL